jgi:hypothetical protein
MQVTIEEVVDCDVTVIVVSGVSQIVAWMFFVGLCCFAGSAFHNRNKSPHRSADTRRAKENVYDSVPREYI